MLNNKTIFFAVGLLFFTANIFAQEKWSLRDCIEYARENSIQVQRARLTEESYEEDILQSKAALFPSLSGSVSQGFTNAQSRDEEGNYRYQSGFSGGYNLNASWTVFNGKRNLYNIEENKLRKEVAELTTDEIQNNIELSITQTYLQILYARESIRNNENILESTAAQLQQTKDFLDLGSITLSEYAQVEAQYSSDKYNLILSLNAFENYMLQLRRLLELDYFDELEIEFPEISEDEVIQLVPSAYDVYLVALGFMPEIESGRLGIDIANLNKASAKAGYLPTVSVTGSAGTGNIYNESPSFFTQIGRNFNQTVGISLNIPILDNRQNKTNVQKAKLEVLNAELIYIDTRKDLLNTIENLYLDVVSAQNSYFAALEKVRASELSYQLVQEQYSLGMRNTVELTTEKNNYANALQELAQSKYSALLSLKLLNFYQGEEISL